MIEVTRLETIYDWPNADSLEGVTVDGWECCVRKGDFKVGDLIVFIPPDALVPADRPEFAFLAKDSIIPNVRIRAKKLRGTPSYGLVIKAPEGFNIGDDVTEHYNIGHYNPPESRDGEVSKVDPKLAYITKYDVESFQKIAKKIFIDGEEVILTEKIHGENQRFVCIDDEMWIGSRNMWKKQGDNYWWKVIEKYPQIEKFCRENQGYIVYGENYGAASLKYGLEKGARDFVAFDIRAKDNRWLDYDEARNLLDCPWVPFVARIHYDLKTCMEYAEGKSLLGGNHHREGVVISPVRDRVEPRLGRAKLKIVSATFLEKDR